MLDSLSGENINYTLITHEAVYRPISMSMSAHATEYTTELPEMTEPHEQSFASMERQLILEAVPEPYQLQLILSSAWAILSAAFSEENDATIDYLDSNTPFEIVHVRLHLGTDQLLKDAQGELQQRIHRGLYENNNASPWGPQETSEKRPGLPRTIIASEMDDGCRFLKNDYTLAISCRACTSNDRSITL